MIERSALEVKVGVLVGEVVAIAVEVPVRVARGRPSVRLSR